MKNNDVVRVSELGGWSRSRTGMDPNVKVGQSAQKTAVPSVSSLQDGGYESSAGLKEFLESLSRYKWYAFFFAVLVFVVGLLVWLQTYQVSFSAESALLKKNFNPRSYRPYSVGLFESWNRSIEGDVIYMRSDYVYTAAQKITQCIASMTLEERSKYLAILEKEAVGDTEVDPLEVNLDRLPYLKDEISNVDRHWFAIDWNTAKPIPYDEAIKNFSAINPKDSLIISGKQMRTLILDYWGMDVLKSNPETALKPNILDNQSQVLNQLTVTSDDDSGLINVTFADLNEDIAVYISNLFPTALVSANNRIVVTKNHREMSVLQKLTEDARKAVTDAQNEYDKIKKDYDNEVNTKTPQDKSIILTRETSYAEAKTMIAEKTNEKKILEAENEYYEKNIEELEMSIRELLNPFKDQLEYWIREKAIKSSDMKANSPELKRIDIIIKNLHEQSDNWIETSSTKSISEIYNPDSSLVTVSRLSHSQLMDTKAEIERNKKQIEILEDEIASITVQLDVLADESNLSNVNRAKIDLDAAQDGYRALTTVAKNTGLSSSNIPEMYQWTKTATKEKIKAKDTKYMLILIAFVSVVVGLIFARIADVLDTRIKTDLQIKEISPYPILAHIPVLSASEKYITPDSKGTTMHRLAANLFGILGVNLRLNGQKQPDRTIAVTSSLPREGKSFVAFNLAAYYAIEGFNTCLLVADLRNPTLEPFPEMVLTAKPGFLDYLEAKESDNPMPMEETVMKTYIDNLNVIGPGTKKNINPSRLFDQDYFTAYLSELLEHFDTVIIDSPPLMPVVDSSLILKSVKSAVMVVNLGRIRKKDFEDTVRRLELIEAPINGLVINRDQYSVRRKYYAYYSSGYISGI